MIDTNTTVTFNIDDFADRILLSDILDNHASDARILYPDGFSFPKDYFMYDEDNDAPAGTEFDEDFEQFGMLLDDDTYGCSCYYIPKGMEFSVRTAGGIVCTKLVRNGASVYWGGDNRVLTVKFTDFGYKCYLCAFNTFVKTDDMHHNVSSISRMYDTLNGNGFVVE